MNPTLSNRSSVTTRLMRYANESCAVEDDVLVVEEPLEMGLKLEDEVANIGISMRTPGDDHNLVLGFLYNEGLIESAADVHSITFKEEAETTLPASRALIRVKDLKGYDVSRLERAFPISAACGACGKSALESLKIYREDKISFSGEKLDPKIIRSWNKRLFDEQSLFSRTGGLHAAARFDDAGELVGLAEDIGRHNAMDKLVGAALADQAMDWSKSALLLSGRIGYDLMQKAIMVGCPVVIGIGAPSSLAVELANHYNITLLGFLREHRFNVYSCPHRLSLD